MEAGTPGVTPILWLAGRSLGARLTSTAPVTPLLTRMPAAQMLATRISYAFTPRRGRSRDGSLVGDRNRSMFS